MKRALHRRHRECRRRVPARKTVVRIAVRTLHVRDALQSFRKRNTHRQSIQSTIRVRAPISAIACQRKKRPCRKKERASRRRCELRPLWTIRHRQATRTNHTKNAEHRSSHHERLYTATKQNLRGKAKVRNAKGVRAANPLQAQLGGTHSGPNPSPLLSNIARASAQSIAAIYTGIPSQSAK